MTGDSQLVSPPTLAVVARRAGVSRQTVSNAINNPDLLRPDTLVRVQKVISELGYTPNRAARQLRSGSSRLIGLRFDPPQEHTATSLMDRFLHTLVQTTRATGHQILLFAGDVGDPLDGYDDLLRSTAVDAFVLTDTYAGTPQAAFLQERGAPFVAFGRPWEDSTAIHSWVDVDGGHGVALATEHLIEQGHSAVAWLGWEETSRIGEDRRSGWERVMRESGLDHHRLAVRITDNADAARMAAHEQISAGATAFACASDTMALGVLQAMSERRLRPGIDIGLVGFDDSPAAGIVGLSSVRQPLEQVAIELVNALRGVLDGDAAPEAGVVLNPTLAVRRSSLRDEFFG